MWLFTWPLGTALLKAKEVRNGDEFEWFRRRIGQANRA